MIYSREYDMYDFYVFKHVRHRYLYPAKISIFKGIYDMY